MDWFYVLYFVMLAVMLSALIAAHEYGHFLVARLFGMEVEEFSIGFGPKPWTYMVRHGTKFTLRPIPFGGFVRVKGMLPEEDGSEVDIPNGFYSKTPFSRFLMLLAGPTFSILAGLMILIPLHSLYGVRVPGTTVGQVLKDNPAYQAGVLPGDKLLSVAGVPVKSFYEINVQMRDRADQQVPLVLKRKGSQITVTVVPKLEKDPSPVMTSEHGAPGESRRQAKIGIGASPVDSILVKVPVREAVLSALKWPVDMTIGLVKAFTSPKVFQESVGGPGTIVSASYQAARSGFDQFIQIAALLSISLGIFNLLPIPPLDGGQMVVAVIEMFRRGKRLSIRWQGAFQGVGLLLLGCLILTVIAIDIRRFSSPEKPAISAPK